MSMELSALLPRFASRQRVFVSYASEQVHAAKEIALALRQAGHTVYRDEEVIAEGGSYHDVLHDAIMRSDRFVFLVDKNALSGSRYTLSELKFAEQRWPAPRNRVLPVLLDRSIKMADLPAYLRAVDVLEPRGNAAAEVVAAVERTRTMTPRWTAGLVTLVLAVAGAGAVFLPKVFQVNEVAFLPPDKVDFRPLVGPDADPPTTTGWRTSDVAVTGLQFGYQHRTPAGSPAQLFAERVELRFDDGPVPLKFYQVVNISRNCPEGGWLCNKGSEAAKDLAAGSIMSFQHMFRPADTGALTWADFIEKLSTAKSLTVSFTSRVAVERGGTLAETSERHVCRLDTAPLQSAIARVRDVRGRLPFFVQPRCRYDN